MGEAKRNRERLVALVTEQIALWNNPPSEAEADAVAEVSRLPVRTVRRYPGRTLAQMNMLPNECHVNALFMERNDPDRECRRISGYWPQIGNYVVHSVVERRGVLMCVTPTVIPLDDVFPFIPDPDIEWVEEGNGHCAFRKGYRLGIGLRSDPERQIAENRVMLERIAAGMHPNEAAKPPF
jgi:hypothetical protein